MIAHISYYQRHCTVTCSSNCDCKKCPYNNGYDFHQISSTSNSQSPFPIKNKKVTNQFEKQQQKKNWKAIQQKHGRK